MVVFPLQSPSDQCELRHQHPGNNQRDGNGELLDCEGNSGICQALQNNSLAMSYSSGSLAGATIVEASRGSFRAPQMLSKATHAGKMAQRTLLVAYLPRCATEDDVQSAFAGFSTSCVVSIMREGSESKCFGFVKFLTRDEAQSAMLACTNGGIMIKDRSNKAWFVKASWARSELKDARKVKQQCNRAN